MGRTLVVMLSDHTPEKTISAAVDMMGEGEIILLRVLPTVLIEGFADVEDDKTRASERDNAGKALSNCLEYCKGACRKETVLSCSFLLREGSPLEVILSFVSSANPDIIFMAEKDSTRFGSFASGDLASAIRKGTGLPLRLITERARTER
ncbi:MAG: universal stress protein [Thermoplasmata archaeon]|nr:universal stress protein [Thermoplasmata archaeon]